MKVISLNIEKNKHFETVVPFLQHEDPDVVCLQEVMQPPFPELAQKLGMHYTFVPFAKLKGWEKEVDGQKMGVAILTRVPHTVRGVHYYQGGPELQEYEKDVTSSEMHRRISRAVLVVEANSDNEVFTIGTTHFTYTPDGKPDESQEAGVKKLLSELRVYADLVLCGDFNIPRGNGMYALLAEQFTDNIPPKYESSIDPDLHRKKDLRYMVDYLWTKGVYSAENVRLIQGVSDHCAVVGKVNVQKND